MQLCAEAMRISTASCKSHKMHWICFQMWILTNSCVSHQPAPKCTLWHSGFIEAAAACEISHNWLESSRRCTSPPMTIDVTSLLSNKYFIFCLWNFWSFPPDYGPLRWQLNWISHIVPPCVITSAHSRDTDKGWEEEDLLWSKVHGRTSSYAWLFIVIYRFIAFCEAYFGYRHVITIV